MNKNSLTVQAVLILVATGTFRVMDDSDWAAFAGADAGTLICDDHPAAPGVTFLVAPLEGEIKGVSMIWMDDDEMAQVDLVDGRLEDVI